jgi:hypothetical protein
LPKTAAEGWGKCCEFGEFLSRTQPVDFSKRKKEKSVNKWKGFIVAKKNSNDRMTFFYRVFLEEDNCFFPFFLFGLMIWAKMIGQN